MATPDTNIPDLINQLRLAVRAHIKTASFPVKPTLSVDLEVSLDRVERDFRKICKAIEHPEEMPPKAEAVRLLGTLPG